MSAIEEVKSRLDIAEVIGQHVQLAKAGRNFKALCPFHTERTPSFIVSPERQSWHCFGACGEGGDVFSFVMKKEGLEFGQALWLLAERAGVVLPERREEERDRPAERPRQANEAAAQYFQHLLLNSESGKAAREYLERRGIDIKTAQEFLLGYSPAGWETLRRYLGERGFGPEELLAAGLLVEGDREPYDRFRNRLMFPIRDLKGRTIGFGARALDESLPKYLNTPQTAAFDKGGALYALERARDGIRKDGRAVIVEGYMDVIAAHQHGFANVVASMGTSLTERQVRLLKRYTQKIAVALDADVAGGEATLRALSLHIDMGTKVESFNPSPVTTTEEEFQRDVFRIQHGILAGNMDVDVAVVPLPAGKDPDDLIRESSEAWRELVEAAKPLMDFWFEAVPKRRDLSRPKERSEAVSELLPVIRIITDRVLRAHYLQRLSRLALVRESELLSMLARPRGRERGRTATERSPALDPVSRGDVREEFLLALLLRYPSLRPQGLAALPEELLWQVENREVLAAWRRTGDIESLREQLPEELRVHLGRLLERRLPAFDEQSAGAALDDCLRRLIRRKMELEKQASAAALAAQETEVGPSPLAEAATNLWRGEQALADERLAQAADLQVQDLEAGLRLHRRDVDIAKERTDEGLSASRAEVTADE